MMRAVHLSTIRSSTSREGHCASRTDGEEDAFPTLLCKAIAFDAQAESNVQQVVYRLKSYVVDWWFGRPKFRYDNCISYEEKRDTNGLSLDRDGWVLRPIADEQRLRRSRSGPGRFRLTRRIFAHGGERRRACCPGRCEYRRQTTR